MDDEAAPLYAPRVEYQSITPLPRGVVISVKVEAPEDEPVVITHSELHSPEGLSFPPTPAKFPITIPPEGSYALAFKLPYLDKATPTVTAPEAEKTSATPSPPPQHPPLPIAPVPAAPRHGSLSQHLRALKKARSRRTLSGLSCCFEDAFVATGFPRSPRPLVSSKGAVGLVVLAGRVRGAPFRTLETFSWQKPVLSRFALLAEIPRPAPRETFAVRYAIVNRGAAPVRAKVLLPAPELLDAHGPVFPLISKVRLPEIPPEDQKWISIPYVAFERGTHLLPPVVLRADGSDYCVDESIVVEVV